MKYHLYLAGLALLAGTALQAQVIIRGRLGGGYGLRAHQPHSLRPHVKPQLPPFTPTIHFSLGYGFPNLDAGLLPEYYGYDKGTNHYTGPVYVALDYQFARMASIGIMVMHGQSNVSYYRYYSGSPDMNGSLDSWSFLLNMVRYMPVSKVVTPYVLGAIGVNAWKQDLTDVYGTKLVPPPLPSMLAYQVGLGVRVNLRKRAGLFAEAGYGKYVVNGGLTVRF